MGGYVIDTTEEAVFLQNSRTRMILSPEGIAFIMQHAPELIPPLSKEQIQDKSKADGLSKLFVCVQAGWFCTQTIARVAQSLPISLLELTTIAHVFCMFTIYLLWWNKPLDIREPVLITADQSNTVYQELLAYMAICSTGSYTWDGLRMPPESQVVSIDPLDPIEDTVIRPCIDALDALDDIEAQAKAFETIPNFGTLLKTAGEEDFSRYVGYLSKYLEKRVLFLNSLFGRGIKRWSLASRAVARHNLWKRGFHAGDFVIDTPGFEYALTDQVTCKLPRMLPLTFLIAIYGGIHLAGWNHDLPSSAYRVVWRCSVSLYTVAGIIYSLAGCIDQWLGRVLDRRCANDRTATVATCDSPGDMETPRRRWHSKMKQPPSTIIMRILLPGYVMASVSLVVLYVVDFLHLPSASFDDISWSRFIPHFA